MSNRPSGRGGLDLGPFRKSNRPSGRGGLDLGLSKRANPSTRGGVVQSDARILHALESETTKSHRVTNCIPFCSSVLSTRKTGPQGQRPNSNRTGGEAGKLRADLVAAQALTDIAQRRTPFANDSLVPVSALGYLWRFRVYTQNGRITCPYLTKF